MDLSTQSTVITYNQHHYHLAYKLRLLAASKGTLVFLPGIGCIKEGFDGAFAAASLQGYSLLTLDFLGFGESDKPSDFSYTIEDHAAMTKLLIQTLRLDDTVIIGHSMGGAVGLLLAQDVPIDNFISVEGVLVSEDIGARDAVSRSEEAFVRSGFEAFRQPLLASGRKDFTTWAHWPKTATRFSSTSKTTLPSFIGPRVTGS